MEQSNWDKIRKEVTKKTSFASKELSKEIDTLADEIMEYILKIASSTDERGLPIYTGNLFDSTGIGIYQKGVLVAIKTNERHATEEQEWGWGYSHLQNALNNSIGLGNDLTLVIFSSAPIAEMINEEGSPWNRGIGYFDMIAEYATRQANLRFGNI